MPEWEAKIRKRLAPLQLHPAREAEIVEEFALHLDDTYDRLLAEGATPDEASHRELHWPPGSFWAQVWCAPSTTEHSMPLNI